MSQERLSAMIFLVLALTLKPIPEPDKGKYLYDECRAYFLEHPTPEEVGRGNICMAYFEGFVDGKGSHVKYDCASKYSYPELLQIYLGWMKKNPVGMDMTKRGSVELALGGVFMCPAK